MPSPYGKLEVKNTRISEHVIGQPRIQNHFNITRHDIRKMLCNRDRIGASIVAGRQKFLSALTLTDVAFCHLFIWRHGKFRKILPKNELKSFFHSILSDLLRLSFLDI